MDGYDTTIAIRAGEAKAIHRHIPIIAMTANAMKGDKEKCLAVGMNDYTTKPIDAEVLHDKIARWVGIDKPSLSSGTQVKGNEDKKIASEAGKSKAQQDENIIWNKADFLKRIRNNVLFNSKINQQQEQNN